VNRSLIAPRFADNAGLREFAYSANSLTVNATLNRTNSAMRDYRFPNAPAMTAYAAFPRLLKETIRTRRGAREAGTGVPSECTWLVYTMESPHAALSGRFALEHTFIAERGAGEQEVSPISVLEKLREAAV